MEKFKEHVIIEKEVLDEKSEKLKEFLVTDDYDNLPAMERNLLSLQLSTMNAYSRVLGMRINLF